MNRTALLLLIIVVIAAFAIGAIYLYLRKRSERLRSRFGPEYTRAVEETGSKHRAESKLEQLEKRVDKLSIRPLQPQAAKQFRDSWRAIQAKFVDDPKTAIHDADVLLGEVMSARGYPVADFDERAAELSVDHAPVVAHYRAGHEIARRQAKGEASTEDMRQAMIHYRVLFDDLVGQSEIARVRGA